MTENTDLANSTDFFEQAPRTAMEVEIDRLKAECSVWEGRASRIKKEFEQYRTEAVAEATEITDQLRRQLAVMESQKAHLSAHHKRDAERELEMDLLNTKLNSYSSLLTLMVDAGRLSPELLEQVDAGISAMHQADKMQVMRVSELPEEIQGLLDAIVRGQDAADKDDESEDEYEPGDYSDEEYERAMSDEAEGKTFEQTESGLPKRPIKDNPQA